MAGSGESYQRRVVEMQAGMRDQLSSGQSAEGDHHPAPEFNHHSFIIKVWIEEINQRGRATWRGHITHVPGGERRYLRRLSEIRAFIAPYLHAMGVEIGIRKRIKKWLCL